MINLLDLTPASCALFAASILLLAVLYAHSWWRIYRAEYGDPEEPPDDHERGPRLG